MSLKTRTVLLILLIFTFVAGIAYLMYGRLEEDTVTGLGRLYAERQVQFNRARSLHPLMRELALARKAADSTIIKTWAREETDPRRTGLALRELEDYRRFFADRSYFVALAGSGHYYFNDRAGSYTGAELRYTLDRGDPEHMWFFGTMESGDPYRLNVDYDEELGVTKVWINVVIRDGDEALGVLGTGIDLSEFLAEVVSDDLPGVVNIFVDEGGAVQAHDRVELIDFRTISKTPEEQKTVFSLLEQERDVQELGAAMDRLRRGPDGEVEVLYADLSGTRHLIGLTFLEEIDWFNVTLMDSASMLGPGRFIPFGGLLLGALVLFSLASVVVLDRGIVRRIHGLDESMREFAEGTLTTVPEPRTRDEIGRLEEGFRQMASKVGEYTERLETELRTLTGMLPTCMYCKKIRDEEGRWSTMEAYISDHSEAQFSHGICPDCLERPYEE